MAAMPKLQWKRHDMTTLGLALDLFEDPPVSEDGTEMSGWLTQTTGPVQIGVWYGPDQTIDRWRAGFSAWQGVTFESERATRVCGRPARRQQALVREQPPAQGTFTDAEGQLEYRTRTLPAMMAVVVAFEHRHTFVLVGWQIEAAQRKAYQAAEERFFRSLACR
jgi:hypothetical protein